VRRRLQTDPDGPRLVPRNGRLPVLPIRTIGLRFGKRKGWLPCDEQDRRATIRTQVDAVGRFVQSVAEPFVEDDEAWQLTAGAAARTSEPSAFEVMKFFDRQKSSRRRKGAARAKGDGDERA
jgi:hypothetical protein